MTFKKIGDKSYGVTKVYILTQIKNANLRCLNSDS